MCQGTGTLPALLHLVLKYKKPRPSLCLQHRNLGLVSKEMHFNRLNRVKILTLSPQCHELKKINRCNTARKLATPTSYGAHPVPSACGGEASSTLQGEVPTSPAASEPLLSNVPELPIHTANPCWQQAGLSLPTTTLSYPAQITPWMFSTLQWNGGTLTPNQKNMHCT